jgi:hypothetical protein
VTISPETVKVVQKIAQTKSVVITCNAVSGEPATGYGLAEVVLDVDSVKVAGYKAVLADFVSINIPAEMINVEGLTANKTFSIDLADMELPEGVSLVGSNNIVNVTAKIEKKKQNNFRLQLPDDVSLEKKNELYDYTFTDTVAFITVEGISNDLDNMDVTNIVATLDVSGYEEGIYSIPLSVKLPEGITLVDITEVEVEITLHETEPETTEAPPETIPDTQPETTTTAAPETTTETTTEPTTESETEKPDKTVEATVESTTQEATTTDAAPTTTAQETTVQETEEPTEATTEEQSEEKTEPEAEINIENLDNGAEDQTKTAT